MAVAARRWGPLVLALWFAGAAPGAAFAKGGSADAKKAAKHLLAVGASKYKAGDFKAALAAFQQAYATFPSSKILFNIAQAYKALDEPDLAADSFAGFLEKSAEDVQLDERRIKDARAALRELSPHLVHVRVDLSPASAELTLDGSRKVRASFFMKHASDDDLVAKHHLTATAQGFAPGEADFTLADVEVLNKGNKGIALTLAPQTTVVQQTKVIEKPGETTIIPVPEPAKPAAATAPVVLAPTATESKPASTEPAPTPNVTPAATELAQASKPVARPALDTEVVIHKTHTASFVSWGIGAAFAIGATVTGIMALNQNHTSDGATKAKITDALWGCTAAAAITGGVLWFVAPGEEGAGGEVGVAGHF